MAFDRFESAEAGVLAGTASRLNPLGMVAATVLVRALRQVGLKRASSVSWPRRLALRNRDPALSSITSGFARALAT